MEGGDYHGEQMGRSKALPDSAQAPCTVGSISLFFGISNFYSLCIF